MDTAEIAAHLEIQQVLYRYCRGVDRGDLELLRSVYHPGAHDSHGAFKGTGEAFAEGLVKGIDALGLVGQHHITNVLIELDGTVARVESYFMALHPIRPGPGEEPGWPWLAAATSTDSSCGTGGGSSPTARC